MYWNTGEIYNGEWKDGLQNGLGQISFVQGNQIIFIR